MNKLKLLQVSFVLFLSFVSFTNARVLELDERFSNVETQGTWLVMFYAPWCGHCKHLEPTWIQIGNQLHSENSQIAVARLDATKFSSVASKYQIRGFPTIKFFKNGKEFEYNGPRSSENIISFAKRAEGPPVKPISSQKEFINERKANEVMFVYVGEADTKLFTTFEKAASNLFTKINFYSAGKQILPSDISTKHVPTILVLKDETFYEVPNHDINVNLLSMWINSEQFPSYNELTGTSYHSLRSAGKKLAISVMEKSGANNFNKVLKKMALERKFPFTFSWVTGNGIVNSMTYSTIPVPNVVVYDANSHEFYVLNEDQDKEITKQKIFQFFDDIKEGKLTPKGGNGMVQNIKRLLADILGGVTGLFRDSPIIATIVIVLPTLLVTGLCYCLCTITDGTGEGPYTDDEDSDVSENEEELPLYEDKQNIEAPKDPPNDPNLGENDPEVEGTELGDGVRKRVKEQEKYE